ncbi:MAG: TraR/DksA family transcriptional regulator [Candidatus Aminicenantes bacterium]|nr:TraR/DksA family transcriptional regulator [Candidatus Aminicenantes bacterium]
MPSKGESLTKKEIQSLKKKLLERREAIMKKMRQYYQESQEVEANIAQDAVDRAETSYTKEFLFLLTDTEREQLDLINEALRRIEAKEYGLCQSCGQPISKKRLEIMPWVPLCIDCQQKKEKEEQEEKEIEREREIL